MRTAFRMGVDWGDLFSDVVSAGTDFYKAKQEAEAAEDLRKAAEAKAAAARAAAEAAAKSAEAAASSEAAFGEDEILGIPTNYVVIGGVGLGALALVLLLTRK